MKSGQPLSGQSKAFSGLGAGAPPPGQTGSASASTINPTEKPGGQGFMQSPAAKGQGLGQGQTLGAPSVAATPQPAVLPQPAVSVAKPGVSGKINMANNKMYSLWKPCLCRQALVKSPWGLIRRVCCIVKL